MSPNRILIVEVNWLGDVLFSTPFIRSVRNNFPGAYIACMVAPRCKEILEGNPNINEIIIYDEDGLDGGIFGRIRFIKRLKKYRFDTAFLLHRSFTRALIVYLAGAANRIGYYTLKRAALLTVKPKQPKGHLHRVKFYLGLAEAVGLRADDGGCDFFINENDLNWADKFFEESGIKNGQKIIIFNPAGNWIPKRWPAKNFAILGRKISAHFGSNAKILLSGSGKDLNLAQGINKEMRNEAVIVCKKATLKQTAALFKRSDVVISNDSGPLHIAVAVGANAIALFGPTSPEITGPYKADCKKVVVLRKDAGCDIPCYDKNCADYRCMSAITPDEAFEAVKKILK